MEGTNGKPVEAGRDSVTARTTSGRVPRSTTHPDMSDTRSSANTTIKVSERPQTPTLESLVNILRSIDGGLKNTNGEYNSRTARLPIKEWETIMARASAHQQYLQLNPTANMAGSNRALTAAVQECSKTIGKLGAIVQELKAQSDDQLQMIAEQKDMMESQRSMIEEQKATIRDVLDEQKGMKEQIKNMEGQTSTMARQMVEMTEQTTELSRALSSTSLPLSDWPTLPSRSASNGSGLSVPVTTICDEERDQRRTLGLDLTRVAGSHYIKNASSNRLKEAVMKALAVNDVTKAVVVEYVMYRAKHRVDIRVESEEQGRAARANPQWLEALAAGAQLKGETWYPVKCDNVHRRDVTKEGEDGWVLRDDILQTFGEENSCDGAPVEAKKIHWLSKPSDRDTGSLAVYLSTARAAEKLLRERYAQFGSSAAFVKPFIRYARPTRCFNCNQYGHMQGRCTHPAACGICAGEHQTRECQNQDSPKCAACRGPHRVTDRGCRDWIRETAKTAEQTNGIGRLAPTSPRQ